MQADFCTHIHVGIKKLHKKVMQQIKYELLPKKTSKRHTAHMCTLALIFAGFIAILAKKTNIEHYDTM